MERALRDIYPSDDEIAERAFELYLTARERHVNASDHWLRAEEELLNLAALKAVRPHAKPPKPWRR
jgi:hypothetical protein